MKHAWKYILVGSSLIMAWNACATDVRITSQCVKTNCIVIVNNLRGQCLTEISKQAFKYIPDDKRIALLIRDCLDAKGEE